MQAVAEALGVDPKALNYHVTATARVCADSWRWTSSNPSSAGLPAFPAYGDWRMVTRSYAAALRDAFTQLGVLATAFHLPAASGLGALAPVECVLQALVDAGFDIDQAGRALTLITETAYAAGRAAVLVAQNRVPTPTCPEVAGALESAGSGGFSRCFGRSSLPASTTATTRPSSNSIWPSSSPDWSGCSHRVRATEVCAEMPYPR